MMILVDELKRERLIEELNWDRDQLIINNQLSTIISHPQTQIFDGYKLNNISNCSFICDFRLKYFIIWIYLLVDLLEWEWLMCLFLLLILPSHLSSHIPSFQTNHLPSQIPSFISHHPSTLIHFKPKNLIGEKSASPTPTIKIDNGSPEACFWMK